MSSQMSAGAAPTPKPKVRGVLRAAAINVVLCVVVNVILLLVLKAALNLPSEFPPFNLPPVIMFTTIGTILAGVAFAIVARLARNPVRTWWIVALVALVISGLPEFAGLANPASFPFPGGTPLYFVILLFLHVVSAFISIFTLTRLTQVK